MSICKENYSSVHGYEVLRSEIVHLLAMLSRKSLKERRGVQGLNQDRADIIVAGVAVVDELMRFFNANRLLVNERGVRQGLLVRGAERLGVGNARSVPASWKDSVNDFCQYHAHVVRASCKAGRFLVTENIRCNLLLFRIEKV